MTEFTLSESQCDCSRGRVVGGQRGRAAGALEQGVGEDVLGRIVAAVVPPPPPHPACPGDELLPSTTPAPAPGDEFGCYSSHSGASEAPSG